LLCSGCRAFLLLEWVAAMAIDILIISAGKKESVNRRTGTKFIL
jgi:hypothetical protein